jgi:hypothetical protein
MGPLKAQGFMEIHRGEGRKLKKVSKNGRIVVNTLPGGGTAAKFRTKTQEKKR